MDAKPFLIAIAEALQEDRRKRLESLRAEIERAELDQIRRLLAMPANERTHFLRRRIGFVGSAL